MTDQLIAILGKNNVSNFPEQLEKYSATGRVPSLLLYPDSSDQISEILKLARRHGKKVLIAGNNSQHNYGSKVEAFDWCISLNRMNNIIEHEAADLTVTVESGVTLPQLQRFLSKHRQFLPLDPIGADNRTLGGIGATNSSGPLCWRYGTCRDLVLGMKVVLADGNIIRAGGKTVKNVAGYDLSKLFIGSMGTLGVITELTFKLFPSPAESRTLWCEFDQFDEISGLIQSIASSNLVISRCEYCNRIFVENYLAKDYPSKSQHCLLFNIQGQAEMVKTTAEKIELMVAEGGGKIFQRFSNKDDEKLWHQIGSMNSSEKNAQHGFHCQVSIPKSFIGPIIHAIQKYSIENGLSMAILAHAGNGIINIFWDDEEPEKINQYQSQLESLRQMAQSYQGNMVVRNVTVTSKVTVTYAPELIWGKPGSDFPLMKMIKARYDPGGIFAGGRFMGGL